MKRKYFIKHKSSNFLKSGFLIAFVAILTIALPILEFQNHKNKVDLFENEDESRKENTELEEERFEVKESKSDFGSGAALAICNCTTVKTLIAHNLPQFKFNAFNRSQLPMYILYCKLLLDFI